MKTMSLFVEELKAEQRYHRKRILDRLVHLERGCATLRAWLQNPKGAMPLVIHGPAIDIDDWMKADAWLTRVIADAEKEEPPPP